MFLACSIDLHNKFKAEPSAETREISYELNVDLSADGEVVGFDMDHACKHLDLITLETVVLPVKVTKIA